MNYNYDFEDVLIEPRFSNINSRSEVILERKFTFKNGLECNLIPIIASNMDTIGTFEMAVELAKFKMCTALHKFYSISELENFFKNNENILDYVFYTLGLKDEDYCKFETLKNKLGNNFTKNICLDVANGYTNKFLDFVSKIRNENPDKVIMAGSVVTPEGVEMLFRKGVDIVKLGIGSGCFVGDSLVLTDRGLVKICDIEIGDKVLTHTGNWQHVTYKFKFYENKNLVEINEKIRSTLNHKFYVLEMSDLESVNDSNLSMKAKWIEAKDLTNDHLLIVSKNILPFNSYNNYRKILNNYVIVEIESKRIISYSGYVYDLEVGGLLGDHSYNIEGVIVHNSVCTTRIVAGVGKPQLSAIIECVGIADKFSGYICSDGGIKNIGDFGKAFGAGADFVMCGGIFSGHKECSGKIIKKYFGTGEYIIKRDFSGNIVEKTEKIEEKTFMEFYGMSSERAMKKHFGGVSDYRTSEGKAVLVPYRGEVKNTVKNILGGIRSTCTYVNASNIEELKYFVKFIKVHRQKNNIFDKNEEIVDI